MKPNRMIALLAVVAALTLASAAPPKATPKLKDAKPTLLTEEKIDTILGEVKRFDALTEINVSLRELLAQLTKLTSLPIEMADGVERMAGPGAAVAAGGEAQFNVRLPAGTMTVEQRLTKTLAAASRSLTFLIRRGHVEITTKGAALREMNPTIENPLDDAQESSDAAAVLPALVRFARFDNDTLEDACEKLATRSGVSVAIDPRSKEAAETKVKARLVNVPVADALAVVADMAGLSVVRRGKLYYLTTPKNAEKFKPGVFVMPPGFGGIVAPGVAKP